AAVRDPVRVRRPDRRAGPADRGRAGRPRRGGRHRRAGPDRDLRGRDHPAPRAEPDPDRPAAGVRKEPPRGAHRTPRRGPAGAPVADQDRAVRLRRAKRSATGLLVAAALVFAATLLVHDPPGWVGYLRATAEASMVGALADWFAVTALFRRPMRLPIPHTAIIPAKKDALGESLGLFVQQNFLAREVILGKLRSLGVASRLGAWLARPENAARLGENAGDALGGLGEMLRDEDIHAAVEQIVRRR